MEKLVVEFRGNGEPCLADVELEGIADSWRAHARINGPTACKELHITYRLGDFLSPMFVSQTDLHFFSLLLEAIAEKATVLLPAPQAEA